MQWKEEDFRMMGLLRLRWRDRGVFERIDSDFRDGSLMRVN